MNLSDFHDFYENKFVKDLSKIPKWTVSDNTKMPIDMWVLKYKKQIYGAMVSSEYNPLCTLNELLEILPNASNHAFRLDALTDRYVVLDIEPKCPDDIKADLLNLPYIYGEKSMSGLGYHLVFELPDIIKDYPIAATKVTMQEENGYYEILMNHFVTFTRNAIDPVSNYDPDDDSFIELFKELASIQKEVIVKEIEMNDFDLSSIPNAQAIIDLLKRQTYHKQPSDFVNKDGIEDISKYEFGYMGFLFYKLKCVLEVSHIKKAHEYTDNEKIHLLYIVAKDKIPHRDKHDTERNGLPWLLYMAQQMVAKSNDRGK